MIESTTEPAKREQLKKVAESYFEALRQKSFSTIPYSERITLRAPLTPGGVRHPVKGKQEVFKQWWQPLEAALEGVSITIVDHFYNSSMTGIITKAEITLGESGITLRVADLFIIDEAGMITEQENHFDSSLLK